MKKYFAGIGSRETPQEVLEIFTKIGKFLAQKGYTLRSGAAPGADTAFEIGANEGFGNKEIFLPWRGFNGNYSTLWKCTPEALRLAAKYHPAWDKLKDSVRNLMARNCYQILGFDLNTPVDFVVCYTKGASGMGGTGQALRLAKDYDIKIYDFGSEAQKNEFREFYKGLKREN